MQKGMGWVIALLAVLVAAEVFRVVGVLPRKTKWLYKVDSVEDTAFDSRMKLLGSQGWEVVAARRASGVRGDFSYEFVFKRPTW